MDSNKTTFNVRSYLVQEDKDLLKRSSVEVINLQSEEVKSVIKELKEYMEQSTALGIAAVQLGHLLRIFVMRKPWNSSQLLVVINPRIVQTKGMSRKAEGCLSIPNLEALVQRPSWIWVDFTDEDGNKIERELLVGLDARVFQHELDHLNGKLIADKPHFMGWLKA